MEDIIFKYSNELNKRDMFDFLYSLKNDIEFNSNIFDINKIYTLVCSIYNDSTPLYQSFEYSDEYTDEYIIIGDNDNADIKITTDKELEEVEKNIMDIFSKYENDGNNYAIVKLSNHTDIEYANIFSGKIIPSNFILPKKYVHKLYTTDYFVDGLSYYRINENRLTVSVLDFRKKVIKQIPYNEFYTNIDRYVPIIEDIYRQKFNKLLKIIHES